VINYSNSRKSLPILILLISIPMFQNCGSQKMSGGSEGVSTTLPSTQLSASEQLVGDYLLSNWTCGKVDLLALGTQYLGLKQTTFSRSTDRATFTSFVGAKCVVVNTFAISFLAKDLVSFKAVSSTCSADCTSAQCAPLQITSTSSSTFNFKSFTDTSKMALVRKISTATENFVYANYSMLGCAIGDDETITFSR
jgi:hydroxyethylthiazole kinase-like sugar kinase family protein